MNQSSNRLRWAAAAGAGIGALGLVAGSFGAAGAAAGDIQFTLDQVATGSPGQVIALGTHQVPDQFQGRTCAGSYLASNNSSVHPGTDLIIASDGSSVTVSDVEDAAGGTKSASGPLTLGDTITVSVRLGADGIASLGEALSFDCPDVAATTIATTTTTTMPATTTTAVGSGGVVPSNPTTTAATTTTTSAVGSNGPVPTALGVRITPQSAAVGAGTLPATGSNDATPMLLAVGGAMVVAGAGARRVSLRRATRGGAR